MVHADQRMPTLHAESMSGAYVAPVDSSCQICCDSGLEDELRGCHVIIVFSRDTFRTMEWTSEGRRGAQLDPQVASGHPLHHLEDLDHGMSDATAYVDDLGLTPVGDAAPLRRLWLRLRRARSHARLFRH